MLNEFLYSCNIYHVYNFIEYYHCLEQPPQNRKGDHRPRGTTRLIFLTIDVVIGKALTHTPRTSL